MQGWIKLERAIQDHWIFEDPIKLKWWITILLNVNHTEKKVNIGNKIYLVKRGESIKSLSNWAELFKTDKSSVRRYFELLKTDTMIDTKNEHKTTRLTICNYESYVDDRNASETQVKRKRNGNETHSTPNNNDNNENNEKENVHTPPKVSIDFNNYQTWVAENAPKLLRIGKPLTNEQFLKIREKYSKNQIIEVCKSMEAKKDFLTKYDNLNLTMQNWLKRQFGEGTAEPTKRQAGEIFFPKSITPDFDIKNI
jgi:hypothetical protein